MADTKLCKTCNKHLPLSEMKRHGKNSDGSIRYDPICKHCVKLTAYDSRYQKDYRQRRKQDGKTHDSEYARNARLKTQYGITAKQYDEMSEQQNHVCAICGCSETSLGTNTNKVRKLAVDHCHQSGKVRGLLCMSCNTALGKFKDSEQLLINAIKYLKGRGYEELNYDK